MFTEIYARSMYSAILHNDQPLRPLPPYQGLRVNQDTSRPRVLLRLFQALRTMIRRDTATTTKTHACDDV